MFRATRFNITPVLVLLLLPGLALAGKIDPGLQARMDRAGTSVDVIIDLVDAEAGGPDLSLATGSIDTAAQIRQLRRRSRTAAPELQQLLQRSGARQRQELWLINAVAVSVPVEQLATLAASPQVHRIREDRIIRRVLPVSVQSLDSAPLLAVAITSNASRIGADAVWQQGYTGAGVVVATMDSGVDLTHPELGPRWRGGDNSWFDPYGEYAQPVDNAAGHGTNTLGVIVGGTEAGIAPDAVWIAARIFNSTGTATTSAVHASFQWMLDPDGNPMTDDAPQVISNSWAVDGTEGSCDNEFQEDIDALNAAGIAVVFAGGNYGPLPGTSVVPANNSGVLATGAVDEQQQVTTFSSRGPSACDGSVYPHITAPGVNIMTTDIYNNGLNPEPWAVVEGTSIAAPFVSGTLALMRQAAPEAPVKELFTALKQGATDRGESGPDNLYGHGVVNAAAAVDVLLHGSRPWGSSQDSGGAGALGPMALLMLLVFGLRRQFRFAVLALMALLLLPVQVQADTAADRGAPVQTFEAPVFDLDPEAVALGKRLYREGITAAGKPVEGIVAGDVRITGDQLACSYCHKRSGFGATEGEIVTPQVTGDILYVPQVSRAAELYRLRSADKKTRPAYDDKSLARAIREGLNPEQRHLDPLMPRYVLGAEDTHNLISYLKSMNSRVSPGVTEEEITMALVISRDVEMSQRRALLRVMRRFMRDRNKDTRPHTARAQKAPWHKKWHYESHRVWDLRIWDLDGPPETWKKQLEVQYGQKPVFAVLGGLLGGSGDTLAEFCEEKELPCLFPMTDFPSLNEDNYYTAWFSRGLFLEAEVLATHLQQEKLVSGSSTVVQLVGANPSLDAVARHFAARMQEQGVSVRTVSLAKVGVLSKADVAVYWLDDKELAGVAAAKLKPGAQVYLSAQRLDVLDNMAALKLPAGDKVSVYLTWPWQLPKEMKLSMRSTLRWLELRQIALQDRDVLANSLYTAKLVARIMKHLGSNYSREYLLERLEHLDRDVALSPIYSRLSLGPGQRYGSKGAYVVQMNGTGKEASVEAVSKWIIPD